MGEEDDDDTVHLLKTNSCSSMQKICYGLGHVFNDLCAAIWFSYTLFYFQIILQMDASTAGTLIMIGQVADSLATPVAGWAVDSTGVPLAWWHLTGTCAVAIGFSLMFSWNPGTHDWWSLLYYAGLVVLFQIGWAIVQISHLSVLTSISKNNAQSADLTAIRFTASVCCSIFVYLITWSILRNSSDNTNVGPEDFNKFKEIVLIITAIGLLSSVIFYCGTNSIEKSTFDILTDVQYLNDTQYVGRNIFKYLATYQVSFMYMSSRLYTTLNLIYMPLYLDERLSHLSQGTIRGTVATVPLVCYITSLFTSLVLKNRCCFITDKIIYVFGLGVSLLGCAWIAVGIPDGTDTQVYFVACLIGVGGSATMVASLCLTANFVSDNCFKGGCVYSTVTFTDKLISGGVILLIQHLKCEVETLCPYFYKNVIAYGTGMSIIIGLISWLSMHVCCNSRTIRQ